MSNESFLSTKKEKRIEWRKRFYFKPSTLLKLKDAAQKTLRTDETMVVWIVEQYFNQPMMGVNGNDK